MAQTNYNKYILIAFDRSVNFISLANEFKAYTIEQTIRDHYLGVPYTKITPVVSVSYALTSEGLTNTTAIILKCSDENNFRKAEGSITLHFKSSLSTMYGEAPKDRVASFDRVFVPLNIDNYQNPYCVENVRTVSTSQSIQGVTPIILHKADAVLDNVKTSAIAQAIITVSLIGVIKP